MHSFSTKSSTSNMSGCQCGRQPGNMFSFDLPISRRGLFFQDSFFNNSYDHLDSTVRRIMERWGATDLLADRRDDAKLSLSNNLSRYRQLRTHNLKEEDQAVTVVSDSTSHKIMMDVHDFVSGELKVKVVGEREVMVEGRFENNKGDFAMSSNSFKRRFCLPQDTNMKAISSVMSSDGVLTITAPRIVQQIEEGNMEIPIRVEGAVSSGAAENSFSNFTSSANTNTTNTSCNCQSGSQDSEVQTNAVRPKQGQRIPIKINATLTKGQQHSQVNENVNSSKVSHTAPCLQHTATDQVNSESTVQAQNSSSSTTSKSRNVSINTDNFLPITRRGLFFNDSYFEGIRQDFQSAVNDVLSRWGEGSLLGQGWDDTNNRVCNNLSRYRQLRAHDLKVDNQAITITSDDTSHKIVMDVHDFVKGEVKVKVVGEREVMVEGRLETHDGDFAVSSNSFRRRFCLPQDTNMEAISSVMSSDGVLTFTAPRTIKQIKNEGHIIPVKVEDNHQTSVINNASNNTTNVSALLKTEEVKRLYNERENLENTMESTFNEQKMKSSTTTSTQADGTVRSVGTVASHDAMKTSEAENVSKVSEQSKVSSRAQTLQDNHSRTTSVFQPISLPVTTRGLFFADSFFKDTWQDFQDAVRDVVSRWGNLTSTTDNLTSYRSLRAQDLRDETQAVKSSEDEYNYKIVVDVQDFTTGGTINVKCVNEREVVVEGQMEREEGGTKFRKQFHRRFVLPRDIYLESVTSVMSSDGVLTITAPKKPTSLKIKEMIIPMSIEEGLHKSESLIKVSEEHLRKKVEEDRTRQTSEVQSALQDSHQSVSGEVSAVSSSSVQSTTHQEEAHHGSSTSSLKTSDHREHIIPVRLEGQEVTMGSLQQEHELKMGNSNEIEERQKNDVHQSCVCSKSAAQSEVCQSVNKSAVESEVRKSSVDQQAIEHNSHSEASQNIALRQESNMSGVPEHSEITHDTRNICVPISRKGALFSDSFFEDTRKHFTDAVRKVLKNTEENCSHSDELTSYRSLLRRNPNLENQAVHMEEDQHSMKIILDVNDFVEGDVKVEIIEGKEMVVEGQAAQEEGSSASTLSFRRVFTLPRLADTKGITSAISSDGVLTIMIPKLQEEIENDNGSKEVVTESQSRLDTQGAGSRGWEERKEREETKESEDCSSHSYNSSYRSQQQFSSTKTF